MQIEEHVSLAEFTTFRIGGLARFFARVASAEELRRSLDFARDQHQRVLMLGGGSNVLIDDAGFDGLVIKIEIQGVDIEKETLIAGAGEQWDALVARASQENLWGIENLSGIPGTAGGAVAGNIGAYGQALSQTLQWVEVFDTETDTLQKITNDACAFGYRDSIFVHDGGRYVILRAAFSLAREGRPEISYKDLAEQFPDDTSADIHAVREAILRIRQGKFPDLDVEGTAGSFFKNPMLSHEDAQKIHTRFPQMPLFAMPETGGVKIPLAWLLDHVLRLKGMRMGGARLFEKQPLVIAAARGCSARDVRELAKQVQEKVFENFGMHIEPEVKIIE